MTRPKFSTPQEYLQSLPTDTQVILRKVAANMRQVLPQCEEVISYNIPCFKVDGRYIVYYAGYDAHISIYPQPRHADSDLNTGINSLCQRQGNLKIPTQPTDPLRTHC